LGEQAGNGKFTPIVPPFPLGKVIFERICSPMLTDAQCRNALVPPAPRERFSELEACTLRSVLQDLGAGSGSIEKTVKKVAWRLGSYPQVSLTAARKARDVARLQKSEGIDPAKARKLEKLVNPTGLLTLQSSGFGMVWQAGRAGVQVMQSEHFVSWSVTCSRGLVIGKWRRFSPWSWRCCRKWKRVGCGDR
jgi:hypothetical protein